MLLNFTTCQVALRYIQSRSVSYFITTPIFYANASPHLGHVHTVLLADALNIYHKLTSKQNQTIFSTGMDEHGIKIQNAAQSQGIDCQEFCDNNTKKFSSLFDEYRITKTHFVRTTEHHHQAAVGAVWSQLNRGGYIYKDTYSGWYCTTDETFVPESQVNTVKVDDKEIKVDQNGNPVHWVNEQNYMFRLKSFEREVLKWLESCEPVIPKKFNEEAIRILKQGSIGDISVSRPTHRLNWGIRVPDDSTQTIYVWLDALTSYLTVAGYRGASSDLARWPVDCQVIGKDILKFHAIYWPAFLMALNLPLPKNLLCHSHWLIDSYKMSKSRGNVINPIEENQVFTPEGMRYFLLRAATTHSDTNYSRSRGIETVNAELADTYGNLLSRCCARAINRDQVIPVRHSNTISQPMSEIIDRLSDIKSSCSEFYGYADFHKGVDEIMHVLRLTQSLYQNTEPWNLVKKPSDMKAQEILTDLQAVTFETLRICSILLQPIIPHISNSALDRMNVKHRNWDDAAVCIGPGDPETRSLSSDVASILFKRIKLDSE